MQVPEEEEEEEEEMEITCSEKERLQVSCKIIDGFLEKIFTPRVVIITYVTIWLSIHCFRRGF